MMSRRFLSPSALLEELGIYEPSDIKIEAVAQYCGATVIIEPLDGCEARIIGYGDRAIIAVNARASRPRQRFSAAHELGHWMKDRGDISFKCSERSVSLEWGAYNPERGANRYATDLLLPESMFKPRARGRDMTIATAEQLSAEFGTSLTASILRLVEIGSYPAMVVCTERGRVRWAVPGPDVPRVLRPRDIPGAGTVVSDLMKGKLTGDGPTEVYADEWFDVPGADRYAILEDTVRIYADAALSLLWWKDESQILDLSEDDE